MEPARRALILAHGTTCIRRLDLAEALYGLALAHGAGTAQLEETALQVVAYGGFPSAIGGLETVRRLRGGQGPTALEQTLTADEARRRGRQAFADVYRDNTEPVLAHLDALIPGFSGWVLEAAYGRILSRSGLTLVDRELMAVCALGLMGLERPLESHVRGALHNGSTPEHVDDILRSSRALAEPRSLPAISRTLQ